MFVRCLWIGAMVLSLGALGCGSDAGSGGPGDPLDGGPGGDTGLDGGPTDPGDGAGPCEPQTCEDQNFECGPADDGCGGTILCGTCPEGEMCGGGGVPHQCDVCEPGGESCVELGHECGFALDNCGNIYDCAEEGLGCGGLEVCQGTPSRCVNAFDAEECELCAHVPDCDGQPQLTQLTGRVITPGRVDANTGNQVGVPNAFVYILRNNTVADLPPIDEGVPADGGQHCDNCEDQDLGPVLVGAVTNGHGEFTLEGNIPVGTPYILVVKAGKFRRAQQMDPLPAGDACTTVELGTTMAAVNPTRLPRDRDDGLAVHIPRVAVSTGLIDAMECVFEKMGIAHDEFTAPKFDGRIHLYRDNGAWPPAESACAEAATIADVRADCPGCGGCTGGTGCGDCKIAYLESTWQPEFDHSLLLDDPDRLGNYDMVISDCRGNGSGDPQHGSAGAANLRRYTNAGGRIFASHWSQRWVDDGAADYNAADPLATGLGPAVNWQGFDTGGLTTTNGTGRISEPPRSNISPRIQTFIDWMLNEGAVDALLRFGIPEPRSRALAVNTPAEEFTYCQGNNCTGGSIRPQQVAYFTPLGAPEEESCGRIVYTGFHVSTDSTRVLSFPAHCDGDLSPTEKSLLYLLFDLGACVGPEPEPPPCNPDTCDDHPDVECGLVADGCGGILNCGECPDPYVCGAAGVPNQCDPTCQPLTCESAGAECTPEGEPLSDGCGGSLDCGGCPSGHFCDGRNRCVFVG
jgi:hypothetical protein